MTEGERYRGREKEGERWGSERETGSLKQIERQIKRDKWEKGCRREKGEE